MSRSLRVACLALTWSSGLGCDLLKDDPPPAASAEASAPSASASSAPPPPEVSMEVVGEGVQKHAAVSSVEACNPRSSEIATYLKRGELTIAGNGERIAAAWLVQLRGQAKIGFAGFDTNAEQAARDRGIGSAKEHPPRLFGIDEGFAVLWFDAEGLAYAFPDWDSPHPPPPIRHLSVVKEVPAADVGLAKHPDGSLIAASPFGTGGDQLSVFLFSPDEETEDVKAVGVTKSASKPHHPAVVGDRSGYTLAWHEGDDRLAVTRFDVAGKELTPAALPLYRGDGEGALEELSLTALGEGSLAVWRVGESLLARYLDASAVPVGPIWKLGTGKWVSVVSMGDTAMAYWADGAGEPAGQLVAARITKEGPRSDGLGITPGSEVKDPPVAAMVGDKIAFAWTEVMSSKISSKRAMLRVVDVACLP